VATPYYLKRDYGRALELLRQANELGPAFSATWEIGVYIQNRLFNETLTELGKAKGERKNDSILIYDRGIVYAVQGKRAEALQIIKELEEMSGGVSEPGALDRQDLCDPEREGAGVDVAGTWLRGGSNWSLL
jgi:tetratricopeptide (TPR) repeat protein